MTGISCTLVQFIGIAQCTDITCYYLDNIILEKNSALLAVLQRFNGVQASNKMLKPLLALLDAGILDNWVIKDTRDAITIPTGRFISKISLILTVSGIIHSCQDMTSDDFDADYSDEKQIMQGII